MYGFQVENGAIKDVGRVPINVRDIQATIVFGTTTGLKATVLDLNGYADGNALPLANGRVDLKPDALYTIVTR